MLLTVHASLAVLIGQHVKSSWLAFILGIISHFFLDAIPHGDKNIEKNGHIRKLIALAILDTISLGTFLAILFTHVHFAHPKIIAWAIIGSIIPDISWGLKYLTKTKIFWPFPELNYWAHHIIKFDFTLPQGLIIQTITFVLCLIGIKLSL